MASKASGHFLTVEQAAAELNLSFSTIHRLVKTGELVPERFGRYLRFTNDTLDQFKKRRSSKKPFNVIS